MADTIMQSVRDALRDTSLTRPELVARIPGYSTTQIDHAIGMLRQRGEVVSVSGAPGELKQYRIVKHEEKPKVFFNFVEYKPLKGMHRPVYKADGCVIREFITGRELK